MFDERERNILWQLVPPTVFIIVMLICLLFILSAQKMEETNRPVYCPRVTGVEQIGGGYGL